MKGRELIAHTGLRESPNLDSKLFLLCPSDRGGKGERLVSSLGEKARGKITRANLLTIQSRFFIFKIAKEDEGKRVNCPHRPARKSQPRLETISPLSQ